jgi:ectoine hydroxylase-related dioxygenase (phytanoyl-CoA dioxygenase family)
VSLLVALQDVDASMGPTYFFPKTNTPEWHMHYILRGLELEELLSSQPYCAGELKAGDAILYDTTLLHCASSAEHSERRRTLLTLSAQEENVTNVNEQANIKPGYRSSLKLNRLNDWKEKD